MFQLQQRSAAFVDICVTVLNVFVVVMVVLSGPDIFSVKALPSMSVPVIVKVTPDKSFEEVIVTQN